MENDEQTDEQKQASYVTASVDPNRPFIIGCI